MNRPAFKEAFRFWIKLGFISFGGPAGQIAIMHEYLVEKKKWISETRFLHALNYCMLLPGPEAQQLATYIGWLLHGTRGGLAAGVLFILPSMLILFGLSVAYVLYGNIPAVYAMFSGLKPAVIAIVLLALVKIGRKSLTSVLHLLVAAGAFVSIFFLHISFPFIILGAAIVAIIVHWLAPGLFLKKNSPETLLSGKKNSNSFGETGPGRSVAFSFLQLIKQSAIAVLLWVVPLVIFYFFVSDFSFWKTLTLFFTRAAFVTFGGAYAVLPYVAQVSVEKLNWLTSLQMIDGLALGETTPGPLIMVLAFVGFMAGYNHFGLSIAMGAVGLLATTYYTFLPCFFFIFAGAPAIERTLENKKIKSILSIVTASVVGVILNLTVYLGEAVLLPNGFAINAIDYAALAWTIISFIALFRFKANMIVWILVSALSGLLYYFIALRPF